MNVVIASDSFKGSATSLEVSKYLERGIKQWNPSTKVKKLPIADGGEGTVEALVTSMNGVYVEKRVTGPLGDTVSAKFGIVNKNVAVIAMAEASGLTLLKDEERDPYVTTSYGTGELIKAALDYGVEEILIGIGGSATNDGGVGMAQALGVSFKSKKNSEVRFGAAGVREVETIDISNIDKRINSTKITVLSDVTNPLCGYNGASYTYGPQKGASDKDVEYLDEILYSFGKKIEKQLHLEVIKQPGSGAAGGLGAGLIAFCKAKLESGVDKILELIKMEQFIKNADLVITGEGRMDYQSVNGKAPIGVAEIAKKFNIPVIAVVGSEGKGAAEVYKHGIDLIINIINEPMTLTQAVDNVENLIKTSGEKVMRAYLLSSKAKTIREEII